MSTGNENTNIAIADTLRSTYSKGEEEKRNNTERGEEEAAAAECQGENHFLSTMCRDGSRRCEERGAGK